MPDSLNRPASRATQRGADSPVSPGYEMWISCAAVVPAMSPRTAAQIKTASFFRINSLSCGQELAEAADRLVDAEFPERLPQLRRQMADGGNAEVGLDRVEHVERRELRARQVEAVELRRAVHRLARGGVHLSFGDIRSEEHTSELQSLAYLVCRLLLEKKKQ